MEATEQAAESGDVLFQKVYLPVFQKVAASRGHVAQSDDELADQLKIAACLRVQEQAAVQQAAKAEEGTVKAAASHLEALTFGEASMATSFADDPEVNKALTQICG